jgi:hypothetical protein
MLRSCAGDVPAPHLNGDETNHLTTRSPQNQKKRRAGCRAILVRVEGYTALQGLLSFRCIAERVIEGSYHRGLTQLSHPPHFKPPWSFLSTEWSPTPPSTHAYPNFSARSHTNWDFQHKCAARNVALTRQTRLSKLRHTKCCKRSFLSCAILKYENVVVV